MSRSPSSLLADGTIYLVLTTTSAIYRGVYGQSVGISGLHYLSLALGFMIASCVLIS